MLSMYQNSKKVIKNMEKDLIIKESNFFFYYRKLKKFKILMIFIIYSNDENII